MVSIEEAEISIMTQITDANNDIVKANQIKNGLTKSIEKLKAKIKG